ncbi:hypothetical protein [Streptomyces sp. NPDC005046]
MAFLDDAHRLGLLRTVGPVYQFRHAELQDHLAPPLLPPAPQGDPEPAPAAQPWWRSALELMASGLVGAAIVWFWNFAGPSVSSHVLALFTSCGSGYTRL